MKPSIRVLCVAFLCLAPAFAFADGPAPNGLVAFSSNEGVARLSRTGARMDFPILANHFEAQSNNAFCGPTSAAVVLNALFAGQTTLPRDRSRLRESDTRFLPPGADLSLPRFTQENVIERGAKSRAQVLGEPMPIGGKVIADWGYQLSQFEEMLRANGAKTRKVVVSDALPESAVREDLVANLGRRGDYVIVNYVRRAVGQEGGGHFSPLGAYDADSDAFLLLDVNPAAAGWVWIPAATLIKAMRTFDTLENRGYVVVSAD
jgi:hypothetical protein